MIVHVVLFQLHRPEETGSVLIEKIKGLREAVPSLESIRAGQNIVKNDRSYDVGIIAQFKDKAALRAYDEHPAHREVLSYIKEISRNIVAVDWEEA